MPPLPILPAGAPAYCILQDATLSWVFLFESKANKHIMFRSASVIKRTMLLHSGLHVLTPLLTLLVSSPFIAF